MNLCRCALEYWPNRNVDTIKARLNLHLSSICILFREAKRRRTNQRPAHE